jgi:hypothetical protein
MASTGIGDDSLYSINTNYWIDMHYSELFLINFNQATIYL